jgi:non-ribosomal peptide synthetase component F
MLALLRAGGSFVPLDPDDPVDRLSLIASGVELNTVLTPDNSRPVFEAAGLTGLSPDLLPDRPVPGHEFVTAAPADLAHVIHTFGSTGRPKGVGIPCHALDHLSAAITDVYRPGPGDRVLQFSSIVFDGSIEEVFPAAVRRGHCGGPGR